MKRIARVHLRQLSVFIFLLALCAPAFAARRHSVRIPGAPFDVQWTEGGYADKTSVEQGGTITFRIATSVNPFTVTIANLADLNTTLTQIGPFTSRPQNCSGAYRTGCGWDATTTFAVPANWPSGYYAASFQTAFGVRRIIFIVRSATPGALSKTVIVAATNTYQAYNSFGGESLYPSDDPDRATHLSFDRPFAASAGLGRFDGWESLFLHWMTSEHRAYEVISDNDLEDPTILAHYNLVVFVGHSEYWTSTARQNLETYSHNGGHIAIFSGTTMWWRVRYENNGRLMVGYKDALRDPLYDTNPSLVTTNWWADPLYNPENRIVGTSFRFGGYANRDPEVLYDLLPLEQRTGFFVADPTSWAFSGTGLTKGQEFGKEVAGLEVDGALYNCNTNGDILGPDGSDGTPLNLHIIAETPATEGHGIIGYYTNSAGGMVFNAGSQEWATGLATDPVVQQITRNVLNRLGTGQPEVYDPVSSPILTQELFNCPQDSGPFLPGWTGTRGGAELTNACGYEGPHGVSLAGADGIAMRRDFALGNAPRRDANLRFYVNADAFENRGPFPTPVVTLVSFIRQQFKEFAIVEMFKEDGQPEIRLALRGSDGSFHPGTFVKLTAGWHLVEVSWISPGTCSLQVDSGTPVTIDNTYLDQGVTSVVLEFAPDEAAQNGRVCVDALAIGTTKLGGVPGIR